ncbi:MAG TPA: hypothetical protein VNM14_10080 [Planctomycetota bacterium]|jgi:hypothetical protein|nr:hypothetical protein [Planctomycetota bacterium]
MADSAGKRFREAKKRQQREQKAQRKQLRKDGKLGNDNSGLFAPGEMQRQVVDINGNPAGEVPAGEAAEPEPDKQ